MFTHVIMITQPEHTMWFVLCIKKLKCSKLVCCKMHLYVLMLNIFITLNMILTVPYVICVAILKTISWFVKEAIRLYEYHLVIFTPYYEPSPPPWKVVANNMPSFL